MGNLRDLSLLSEHLSSCRCVVFDLDDTLYLERDYVRSGFCAIDAWVAEKIGIQGFGTLCWQLFEDGRRRDIFNVALEVNGVTADNALIRALVDVYRNHVPEITLLPDAMKCLGALKGRAEQCLITDGPPISQRCKMTALGLQGQFSLAVLTGEWGQEFSKPHPRAFVAVQSALSMEGKSCMYVADNPLKDFGAPAGLGWFTVRVRRAGGQYRDLPNPDIAPSFECENLLALAEAFNTNAFQCGASNRGT